MHSLLRMLPLLRLILVVGLLVGALGRLDASGTYPPAPPRLPADVLKSIDAELYNLGKALFSGRSRPGDQPQGSLAEQSSRRDRLAALQARLPDRVSATTELPALAPRLTDREADAIIYYATRRFHLEKETS